MDLTGPILYLTIYLILIYDFKGLILVARPRLFLGRATAAAAAVASPLPFIGFDKTSDAKDQGPGHNNSHKYVIHFLLLPIRT